MLFCPASILKPSDSLKLQIMQTIKTPFGYSSFSIGNIVIYTGKIRVKTNKEFLINRLHHFAEHLTIIERTKFGQVGRMHSSLGFNYCTITFTTTSSVLNQQLINAISNVLAEIMHDRINLKYRQLQHLIVEESQLEELMAI